MEAVKIPFLFLGNCLCLDFINTEIIAKRERMSLIADFADLRDWLVTAQAIGAAEFARVEAAWNSEEKDATLRGALEFRRELRRMAEQIAAGETVGEDILAAINTHLAAGSGWQEIARTEEGYEKRYRFAWETSRALLAPIAISAADLLAAGDLSYVRKCENPACILYFYDTSKNHQRRWCSMSICGNRSKVAAHSRRKRQEFSRVRGMNSSVVATGNEFLR